MEPAFWDISRAHPHVETQHHKDRVGKLLPHLGQSFELEVKETCVAGGAERGLHHSCALKSGPKAPQSISFQHHGDYVLLIGTPSKR